LANYGLNEKGFRRKQYADIVTDMELRAREIFGENINLSERSFMGLLIRLVAWFLGVLWMLAEKVYYSAFVSTSEGVSLDRAVEKNNTKRRQAEKARGFVEFTGVEHTIVPIGTLVSTESEVMYRTIEEGAIVDGTARVPVEAVEPGTQGNTAEGTITEIVTPIPGVSEVTNEEPITGGRNRETDAELRKRYFESPAKDGASTTTAIRAELLATPGVRAAEVIENDTMNTVNGQPPKSIQAFVLGGQREDIARAILNKKAGGIQAYGMETETVKDESGRDRIIGWTPASVVEVWAKVTVSRDIKYPVDGDERITTLIVSYIGGEDADGNIYNGLTMGQDVIQSRIVSACHEVPGVDDVVVELSTDGITYSTSNIVVGIGEVAEIKADRVVVL